VIRTPLTTRDPEDQPAPRPSSQKSGRRDRMIIIGMAVVILVLVIGLLAQGGVGPFGKSTKGITNKWSAIVLSTGDIFFGHIKEITPDQIDIVNVYYVQKPSSSSPASTTISIVGLVTTQFQCPEDEIIITRNLVSYAENLQDNAYVVQKLNQLTQTPQHCSQPPAASTQAAIPTVAPTTTP
jgi:hypothetical protein